MKTIRIRKFTILSLFLLSLLPWVFFVAAHFMETNTLRFERADFQQENVDQTIYLIEANSDKWKDTAWQNQLSRHLKERDLGVTILSETNDILFQMSDARKQAFTRVEQFSVIQDGSLIGRVMIDDSNSRILPFIAAFAGLILAFVIIGLAMKRWMIKPLEKLSMSAREMAKGDFDVKLPSSPIAEIVEVRDGFNAMVTGLKESFQKQAELENERRFMIAAVAHDLRTPLFALRGYLDGLEQGIARSPEKIDKYVAVCKEKSAQLDRLVEDLFTFSRTEYFENELNQHPVDLSQVIKQSVQSIRLQAQQKNISIMERAFGNKGTIRGDAHLLERAVNNLLDNALRHTPDGGEIVVQCDRQEDKITFTIQDTGKGFSEEELHHVFEPLYRGDVSRSRSTGGAGLGLTISQRIMRQHGGDLTASNHSDGGAVLTGWIPLGK
ncbi:HAMP domain-containing sensor histidine kinase [Brevibacillus sp. AY1]|uniref:sensor histidine kinase n=1 Tax=Brevibacillus sp. AY1 TaxID=2807621 RepID=UPI002458F113|nr:HAMP domain-containing sensor histidine kinase [Brevibacillus sp. AY1]MDH4619319.1 HAMP domain-containing histidine kinase [Brevibacillus sp. AY1]